MPVGDRRRSRIRACVAVFGAALLFAVGCSSTATRPAETTKKPSASSSTRSQPQAEPQKPLALKEYVTDPAGAFDSSARTEIESAIDRLYNGRQINLWVVFVDAFSPVEPNLSSGANAIAWARATMTATDVGKSDGIFAVAVKGHAYAIQMAKEASSVNQQEIESLLTDVKPFLKNNDWKGAVLLVVNRIDDAAASP